MAKSEKAAMLEKGGDIATDETGEGIPSIGRSEVRRGVTTCVHTEKVTESLTVGSGVPYSRRNVC
jgi:hypothetical protein